MHRVSVSSCLQTSPYRNQIPRYIKSVCWELSQIQCLPLWEASLPAPTLQKHKRLLKHWSISESLKLNILSRNESKVFFNWLGKSYFFCSCIFIPYETQTENVAQKRNLNQPWVICIKDRFWKCWAVNGTCCLLWHYSYACHYSY